VRQDSERIERAFGPYTPLEFVVEAKAGVLDPEVMGAIAAWQDRMEAGGEVGWTRSAADVLRRLHEVLAEEGAYTVPTDPAAFEQTLFLYESDPDADLSEVVDPTRTRARVTVGIPMGSAGAFGRRIEQLEALAQMPAGVTVEASGYLPLYVRMMDYIVESQIESFALAFVIVFGLIAVLFRSLKLAALAIPANLLPVLLTLGGMGIVGVRLDVATVTVAAIVLGLVVDDTVQFLYRYSVELRSESDPVRAIKAAVRDAGRPIAMTTIVLALGFSVLVFAPIKSVAYFGALIATALVGAMFCDLLIVPALVAVATRSLPGRAHEARPH
jgi:predicted RND superfamily exporter protein